MGKPSPSRRGLIAPRGIAYVFHGDRRCPGEQARPCRDEHEAMVQARDAERLAEVIARHLATTRIRVHDVI